MKKLENTVAMVSNDELSAEALGAVSGGSRSPREGWGAPRKGKRVMTTITVNGRGQMVPRTTYADGSQVYGPINPNAGPARGGGR